MDIEKTIHWMDAEELAVVVLGIDEETADSNAIEDALFEKFEVSFEQFHKIAEALMPLTIPAKAAISGESFQGFVRNGAFICKQPVTPNDQADRRGFIASVSGGLL